MFTFFLKLKAILLLSCLRHSEQNYITSPAFQTQKNVVLQIYLGIQDYTYFYSTYFPWYVQASPQTLIQIRITSKYSRVMDLIPQNPKFMCFKVNLPTDGLYSIKFQYLIDNNINSSRATVKMNNVTISSFIATNKEPQVYNKNINLTAGNNTLCLGGSDTIPIQQAQIGVLVDNFTFTNTIIQDLVVRTTGAYYCNNSEIILFLDFAWINSWNLTFFQIYSTVAIDGKFNTQYHLKVNQSGYLNIIINYTNSEQNPKQIDVTMPNSQQSIQVGSVLKFNIEKCLIVTYVNVVFSTKISVFSNGEAFGFSNLIMHPNWNKQLSPLVSIKVNEEIVKFSSLKVTAESTGFAKFHFFFNEKLPSPALIEIVIRNNTLVNSRLEFVSFCMVPFQMQNSTKLIQNLIKVNEKSTRLALSVKRAIQIFGSNYYLSSLISFYSLTFLFHVLPFRSVLHEYADYSGDLIKTIIKEAPLSKQINKVETFENLLSLDKKQNEKLPYSLIQFGFSSRFWSNSEECILSLLLTIAKILLVRALLSFPCYFIQLCSQKVKKREKQILLYQIILTGPFIVLPLSTNLSSRSNIGQYHFINKFNIIAYIIATFLCLVFPFFFWIVESFKLFQENLARQKLDRIYSAFSQNSKAFSQNSKKKKSSQKREQHLQVGFVNFIENFMYFLLPMVAGQFSAIGFTSVVSFIVILRAVLLFQWRNSFTKWDFGKQVINRIIWILYCNIHVIYLIFEIFSIDFFETKAYQILQICGICQVSLFIVGILNQLLLIAIQMAIFIVQVLRKLKKKCYNNAISQKIVIKINDKKMKTEKGCRVIAHNKSYKFNDTNQVKQTASKS